MLSVDEAGMLWCYRNLKLSSSRNPKTLETVCQGASGGDPTAPLRNNQGWEHQWQCPENKAVETKPWVLPPSTLHVSAAVILVLPAPSESEGATPQGRGGVGLHSPRIHRELDRAFLRSREGKEGMAAELPAGALKGAGAALAPASCASGRGEHPRGSFFVPASAVVPFPSSVVVSKARCE